MNRVLVIVLLSCICTALCAQLPNNTIMFTLSQSHKSYSDNQKPNDYYSETVGKQDNYILVHDADSSFMVGEIPISFKLTHTEPEFLGCHPDEFCKWLSTKIMDILPMKGKYSFSYAVDFLVTGEGCVADIDVSANHLDKKWLRLGETIADCIKESPRWKAESHFWKKYCTPYTIEINANAFKNGKGKILLSQYDNGIYKSLCEELWEDSPDKVWRDSIPEYLIASEEEVDQKAHLADDSMDIHQWIKANIQDVTEMVGFADGRSTIELLVSANGWVAEANVIESDDWLLGKELATGLKCNCPRWVPAKVGENNVPSKVYITYTWHF